ncbi:hypothetical protein NXV35_14350 [Bacteroides faecis]|jgi:hypothetical protein|nr:hypothetical protein [Bacteroides faecis]
MEYYGKILCISKDDLTRDDRAVVGTYKIDVTKAPIMSNECYKSLIRRKKMKVARKGVGRGVTALVSVDSLPDKYKKLVEQKYGSMDVEILRNWFASHWEVDANARSFYSRYRLASGKPLEPEQQQEYTLNASALQSVIRLMNDVKMKRAVMQNNKIRWEEMAGAISFFQEEFGHNLPLSVNRFKKKVKDFQENGYDSLISKKFGNQNTRKVDVNIERLVLGLATLPNKPWNTNVGDMYNKFIDGELQVCDPETGEIFNASDFVDKKGNPIKLSQSTINNYLNQPKNKVLINSKLMTWSTFMHNERPHVHRHAPEFSFSKISFDDRDLPRKLKDTKQRPKAYYAYDVTSQCVVGFAYNRNKNVDLVVDCFRDMFQRIERNGWNCPAQVEVENHLMSQWKDSFLKAGTMFPFVRFCAPLNSQEKYAEPLNGAKKRSIEHKNHLGIGRFYAKNEKYRAESKKISDEYNDNYEDKQYYTWEELIADDVADVMEFNNSLHPNQKKYPKMTRWQVLESNMNPTLQQVDKAILYRYIGEHVETSIRRNSYCRVNYTNLWLSSPEVLDRLAPNNRTVDAYYLPDDEGNMGDVYIYQNGVLLDKLSNVGTYNTADVEQTEVDEQIMTEQLKKISQFDSMTKKQAIPPVVVMKTETVKKVEAAVAKPVQVKSIEMDADTLISRFSNYKGRGLADT